MNFSIASNTVNTTAKELMDLFKSQDDKKIAEKFDDGANVQYSADKAKSTVSEAVKKIEELTKESKDNGVAAKFAKDDGKNYLKNTNLMGYTVAENPDIKGNKTSLKLRDLKGNQVKGEIAYGSDGSKIIVIEDGASNTKMKFIYDANGELLQKVDTTKDGESIATFNTINGKSVLISQVSNSKIDGDPVSTTTYFNKKGQIIRSVSVHTNTSEKSITDIEYDSKGEKVGERTEVYKNGELIAQTTSTVQTNSKGERAIASSLAIATDGSKILMYNDVETGKVTKEETTDKDGVVTITKDYTTTKTKEKTLYNANLDTQKGVLSVTRSKKGVISHVDCTKDAFNNFVPPEKSAPNSSFIVTADSYFGNTKKFSYDKDGNLIKDNPAAATTQTASTASSSNKKAKSLYDVNNDGKTDVQDVKKDVEEHSPDKLVFDLDHDGEITEFDADEAMQLGGEVQKYIAGVKDQKAGSEHHFDDNEKLDIYDASEAQKVADAIKKYVKENGNTNTNSAEYKSEFDINGDKTISVEDIYAAVAKTSIETFDIDGDGKITSKDADLADAYALEAQKYVDELPVKLSKPLRYYNKDQDKSITIMDVTQLQRAAEAIREYTGKHYFDVNGDTKITTSDVKKDVENHSLNNENKLVFDLDGDENITLDDKAKANEMAKNIKKYLADLDKGIATDKEHSLDFYDFDRDGIITIMDATQANYAAEAIEEYINERDAKRRFDVNKDTKITVEDVREDVSKYSMENFDLDGNKKISNDDADKADEYAAKIKKYLADLDKGIETENPPGFEFYDFDGDKKITILDATDAQQAAEAIREYVEEENNKCPNPNSNDDDREPSAFDNPEENLNDKKPLD